jgi:hypothetical protein
MRQLHKGPWLVLLAVLGAPAPLPTKNPFQNEALSRRAVLDGAMRRPRLRP